MGVTAAAGSFGQFALLPLESALIGAGGWQVALYWLALAALVMAPLGLGLRERGDAAALRAGTHAARSIAGEPARFSHALREAWGSASFRWLTAGYFVCGFQVVFIGVHLPAYLKDFGLAPNVAANALALIGLFNIVGTYSAGLLGARLPRQHVLTAIYVLRSVAIVAFIAVPPTAVTVYLFAAVIGTLWLSTVPLTNGVVAHVFGVRYLSMLSGVVFLSHQVGSFLGVWLGGLLYDRTGSYDVVWYLSIALGVAAALANQPVRDEPLLRQAVT